MGLTYLGWTLHHVDDLPPSVSRGATTPGRYKPFLQMVSRHKKSTCARDPVGEPEQWGTPVSESKLRQFCKNSGGGWGVPSLNELIPEEVAKADGNVPEGCVVQVGGEKAAMDCVQKYVWRDDRLRNYVGSSDSMSPGKHNAINSTTSLSAYLAHGCLSPRRLYKEVQLYERKRVRNRSTYWVFHELVFRDYFAFSCVRWGRKLFSRKGPLNSSGHPWVADNATTRALFRKVPIKIHFRKIVVRNCLLAS